MNIKFVNPYGAIGADFTTGMQNIATSIGMYTPATLTVDLLVDFVYNTVVSQYGISMDMPPVRQRALKSIIYTCINGYLNAATGDYLQYNNMQMNFIFELLEGTANSKNPEDILSDIQDIEDNIAISGLTPTEQMPLLYATQIGKSAYTYWADLMATGMGMGNWGNFTNSFTPNIVKFPFWVAAAMEGALIANSYLNQKTEGGVLATEMRILLEFEAGAPLIINLLGTLAVGAGKVLFNLQKRKITCNPMQAMPETLEVNNNNNLVFSKPCNCA